MAKYIMIGGFLGAGKSTAMLRLATYLTEQGLSCGLITNDQGERLVDTRVAESHGHHVEEIAGGCFCCRFNSLKEAADRLTAASRPDVFLAEPVGSCTDLVATVSYPLRRIYGDQFQISPLSVVLDPLRALNVLGLTDSKRFSEKVRYIYLKQIEEADLVVLNKIDLLSAEQEQMLRTELAARFPGKKMIGASARTGRGLEAWFAEVLGAEPLNAASMQIDYATYGEGEALLGWLNASVTISAPDLVNGNALLLNLAEDIQQRMQAQHAEIAHLKMTLAAVGDSSELAVLNLIRNDAKPELAQALLADLEQGELIINFRAEADPEAMHRIMVDALALCELQGPRLHIDHMEYFKPGMPAPVHRMEEAFQ